MRKGIVIYFMRSVFSSEPIEVHVPGPRDPGSTYPVQMLTGFFRWGCFVPEAYEMAVQRAENPQEPSLAVAGCSIGTEVYTMLGLHARKGQEGSVHVRAYDANRLAIEAARKGLYTVRGRDVEARYKQKAVLDALGFATSFEDGSDGSSPKSRLQVDATPLRDRNEVRFIEHNLAQPLPQDERADLVMANNLFLHVLRHSGMQGGLEVLRNLASVVADRGVMSFDGGTFEEPPRWTEQAVALLDEEFGMQPIFSEASPSPTRQDPVPIMFARE